MNEKETDEKVERIRNNPFVQIGGRIELIKREGYEPKAVISMTYLERESSIQREYTTQKTLRD